MNQAASSRSRIGEVLSASAAETTARRLIPPGPALPAAEMTAVVAELRESAATATDLVLDVMRLPTSQADPVRRRLAAGEILVVDRLSWARANIGAMSAMLDGPVTAALDRRASESFGKKAPSRAAARASGVELGGLLSYLSTRVLGQYEPFGTDAGRLLLVAPSITATAAKIGADQRDFRLWVALHEETHRVQFAVAPWLRGHLLGLLEQLVASMLGEESPAERLTGGLSGMREVFGPQGSGRLVDLIQNEVEKDLIDRITAVMSLLEGHADVVMDQVGPGVIPTVRQIRRSFDRRRAESTGLHGVLTKFLGLDAKLEQYRHGAAFVRGVLRQKGHEGLNRVWDDPALLPDLDEIARPRDWVHRVHG